MNDPAHAANNFGASHPAKLIPPTIKEQPITLRVGGGLGMAGVTIGMLILVSCCFGFGFALVFSFLPVVMGLIGFVLSIIGGFGGHDVESSHVAAGIFINFAAIAGGAMEMYAWHPNWFKWV
jgi:hypothetical protein